MNRQKKAGFTVVELAVVIIVVAILVTMSYFLVKIWREDTANTQVRSELLQATSELRQLHNFTSTYPPTADFSSIYTVGSDVTLTYARRANGTFCLNGSSQTLSTVRWNVDSSVSTQPRTGHCTP